MAQQIEISQKSGISPKMKGPTHNEHGKTHHAVTINKNPELVYGFFRNFRNLPFFMKDLKSVEMKSADLSHWIVQLDNGLKVEWDAEITKDVPEKEISWKSLKDSEVSQEGSVFFERAPGQRGTVVYLSMNYEVPGGKLTEFATKMMGEDPDSLILINLKRLKSYLETGEIPTVEGQPSGREEDLPPEEKH